MGAPVIFVFVLAITAQSVYSHVGLSREGVIEQDKNPEHTSNIKVDINMENSAKESPVSGSHFYHGLSSFGFGQNKKVEQQSEGEVKFHEESHPEKQCSVSCTCAAGCSCSCSGSCCGSDGCSHSCSCCCHGKFSNYTGIAEDLIGMPIKPQVYNNL
ncbi:uncharacterized protein LOC123259493 [Cotesia glomerata]|uniref:uncharacterized protein LOC123259493 n=1 Tax=Cotesia glomerata TaxID=32391 RepID=UPI001D005CEB|nr:uncharacterized protein LOC123259493 [Cotesia glomerata]